MALRAYLHVARGDFGQGGARPSPGLMEAMDALFVALMFIVFTAGVAKVFSGEAPEESAEGGREAVEELPAAG